MQAGEGPSRTKRRPKRRRETRTTTGDRRKREAPQRAASCLSAAARTPHTSAARRRRACASASPRLSRSTRRRVKAARRASVRLYLKSGGRQSTNSQTTTPLPPRLHPHSEGIICGLVARPTLHRPHKRALAAESRGRIELAVRIAGTCVPERHSHTRVADRRGTRGAARWSQGPMFLIWKAWDEW
jgi:hypothetical protein